MFEEPRLDPCSSALRRRLQGRMRFHDFCKQSFSRARPWTPRTSQTAGVGRWDDCHVDRRLPDDSRQSPRALRVRGRERFRILGAPRGDCSQRRLRPNPDRSRAPLVAVTTPIPCPERRGGRVMPPSRRALARGAQREGRAAPAFREEDGRSPTRGAFRRRAARDAGSCAPFPVSRGCPSGRACAFFTTEVTVTRDARTGPDGSAIRRGRVANHSVDDGPQRP